jgi:predicted nucleic acid-binding protein
LNLPKRLLIDTDVLIDLNRLQQQAVDFILTLPARPTLSAVTVVELYAGVRDGRERKDLADFVSRANVVDVDLQIAARAGLIFRQWFKSHGTGFADAIVAATAEIERATLVTLNVKHFPMLSDVLVPYVRP